MASVHHATSVQGAPDPTKSVNANEWNEMHLISGVAEQTSLDAVSQAVSVVSHAVSVLSQQNSVEHAALSQRIDLGGGSNSVTSNELSAASQAASANAVSIRDNVSAVSAATSVKGLQSVVNQLSNRTSVLSQAVSVVSQAVSALSQTNSVDHAALSVRIDTQSDKISVISQQVSALSQAHSALSQVVSVLSNNLSNEISNRQSADNVVSNNASVNAVSVGNVVSQNASANAISIGNVVSNNASANAVSIRNAQSIGGHANVSISATPTSGQVLKYKSVSAQWINDTDATGGGGSVTSAEVSAVSQNASANAVSIANVVSAQAASALSQAISVLSQRISALSIDALKDVSISAATSGQVLKYASASAEWRNMSDNTGGAGGSVTSNEVSAVSAQAASVLSALSFTYSAVSVKGAQSVLNQIASVISNATSAGSVIAAKVPWVASRYMLVSTTQSIQASAVADVTSLVLSMEAGAWEFRGALLVSTSAVGAGLKVGVSTPPMKAVPGWMLVQMMNPAAAAPTSAADRGMHGVLAASATTTILSTVSLNPAGGAHVAFFHGIAEVSTAGTFRIKAGGVASVTASPLHIMQGSYIFALRLS